MRERKYRAWDIKKKLMCDVLQISFDEDGVLGACLDYGKTAESLMSTSFELIEYTGLKDCKGVEIYEGDIVKTQYTDHKERLAKVYFNDFRLNWSVKHGGFTNQDLFVYTRPDCSVEVIGNIHQHPELLEGEEN